MDNSICIVCIFLKGEKEFTSIESVKHGNLDTTQLFDVFIFSLN